MLSAVESVRQSGVVMSGFTRETQHDGIGTFEYSRLTSSNVQYVLITAMEAKLLFLNFCAKARENPPYSIGSDSSS